MAAFSRVESTSVTCCSAASLWEGGGRTGELEEEGMKVKGGYVGRRMEEGFRNKRSP